MIKKIAIVFCLAITIILICLILNINKSKNDINNKIQLNESFIIEKNQTVIFNDEKIISIELINVQDSRCPKERNVTCYWQGELSYSILINEEPYEISTVLNQTINYDDYKLNIVSEDCDIDRLSIIIQRSKGE